MYSESHRLVHSLTAHLALYHSHISNLNPNPDPTPRASVLRWFSSLSPAHRQAALTISDSSFILILLQMQSHLRRQGHSHFLLLPDLPSSSPSNPSLPSLSFRPSRGLISRAAASNSSALLLSNSLLFFSCTSSGVTFADALTVSESLVADVDRFVGVLDGLSGGRFLCEEVEMLGLTGKWVELPWLKDMGYYSLEAFVANRLEVALRLAWISSQGAKKPKEKRLKERATEVSGRASNVFWRMKGCLHWWVGLEPGIRKAIISNFFGKASITLANEIIKEENAALTIGFDFLNIGINMEPRFGGLSSWKKVKRAPFGSDAGLGLNFLPTATSMLPNNLVIILKKLVVVHAISNVLLAWQSGKVEIEKLFFGSLGSNLSVSDHITRKLQRFLMVFNTNFINHELMEDTKMSIFHEKAQEKYNLACRKGKNKSHSSKKSNAMPKVYNSASISQESSESTLSLVAKRNMDGIVSHVTNNALEVKSSTAQEKMDKLYARTSVDSKENSGKRQSRRKGPKNKSSNVKNTGKPKHKGSNEADLSVAAETESAGTNGFIHTSNTQPKPVDISSCDNLLAASVSDISQEYTKVDVMQSRKGIQECQSFCLTEGRSTTIEENHPSSGKAGNNMLTCVSPCFGKSKEPLLTTQRDSTYTDKQNDPWMGTTCNASLRVSELDNVVTDGDGKHGHPFSSSARGTASKSFVSKECIHTSADERSSVIHNRGSKFQTYRGTNSMGGASYEWPSITPIHFPSINSHILPATERLHLDDGVRLPYYSHQSFVASKAHVRNSLNEFGHGRILPSLNFPMSYDWPPMVKNCTRLSHTQNIGYESAYGHSMPPSLYSGIASCTPHTVQANVSPSDNEVKHAGDIIDVYDMNNIADLVEDESYWLSEEESEPHVRSGRDYNNYFGGGVMYWNPAELGTGFSRPPSHSSEDGSWARYEADLSRTIDDMVGCKTGLPTFSTNGMASPPSSSYCSPFEAMASGHPSMGYSVAGNNASSTAVHSPSVSDSLDEKISSSTTNSIEGLKGDPSPYPMLRPILTPSMSRKGSRSDFRLGHDNKSPCIPSTRRDTPLIKRPPSPVVLCVPRVPRPPPPSVGESRKRGFPIVRSGSSSPRHWGVKNWCLEESTVADTRLCLDGAKVVWPTCLGVTAVAQSLQGSLLQDHLLTISQLAHDQEHPDVALPLQPPDLLNGSCKGSLSRMQNLLHEEIELFCKQVAAENLIQKPFINWAVKRITRSLQVLWPRSRTNIFGSNSTGLALPTSDVDVVVCLPPVRNLEPIKEAGILEGRNGIKETCLQHAARYLANQEWVRNDSLKTIENTAIPVIMLLAEVPCDITLSHGSSSIVDISKEKSSNISGEHNSASSKDSIITEDDAVVGVKPIRLDISFKSTSHTGLQTSELVRKLTQQFPASVPLALVLKKFLADRNLDHSYSGGLSSYCLVLLITRFLQHEHHCGYYMKQNLGSLLMEFLYFFGNIFDPRQMGISIQGSGVYMRRERGFSIDPIHIDDPLFPTNNVGRNCFRIHQCIKAFADAYTTLESELSVVSDEYIPSSASSFRLLRKIVPSIN